MVTKTLQQVFPEGKKRWPEWMEEARAWRMWMLDKRRNLREHEGEEFEMVQIVLKEVSSLLKEAREKVNKQRTAELEEEMSEARRYRQCAPLHRVESGVREKREGDQKNDTTSRHAQFGIARTGSEKWRNMLLMVKWSARSWTGKRTTTIT